MKIIVFGSNGQLGQCLKKLEAYHPEKEFLFVSRKEVSITDFPKVENLIENWEPDFLINCAAYTKVDQAETDKEACDSTNYHAVQFLAGLAKRTNTFFIHFSTDYVFDGSKDAPYNEADTCKPINFYGNSKRRGEEAIQASGCKYLIFRTSWLYSEFGNNFVKTIIRLAQEREELGIVSDQIGSPTNANDLAEAVLDILDAENLDKKFGIYHFTNLGEISWFTFANEIIKLKGLKTPVKPIKTIDFKTDAARPHFSVLNKDKITTTMGIALKYWKESLKDIIDEL